MISSASRLPTSRATSASACPFGLSYDLQAEITTTVPGKTESLSPEKTGRENGYAEDCLSLSVDFLQAGASSLDVVVLADFKGDQAPAYRRIERALAKWCVECCNANNWEIPFPQMTVHLPSGSKALASEYRAWNRYAK